MRWNDNESHCNPIIYCRPLNLGTNSLALCCSLGAPALSAELWKRESSHEDSATREETAAVRMHARLLDGAATDEEVERKVLVESILTGLCVGA